MELYQRIKARREALGMSQNELAKRLGYKDRSTIAKIEAGINDITQSKIEAFAAALSTTPSKLMGWQAPDAPLPSPAAAEETTSFLIQTSVAAHYNAISGDETLEGERIEVPTAYLKGRPATDFCAMRVKGNSMYPQFQDGDVVLVLKSKTLDHSGQIGVICYGDDEMTIKRINYVDGEDWLELIPLNSEFPPRRIEGAALEQCEVIGIPRVLVREF